MVSFAGVGARTPGVPLLALFPLRSSLYAPPSARDTDQSIGKLSLAKQRSSEIQRANDESPAETLVSLTVRVEGGVGARIL